MMTLPEYRVQVNTATDHESRIHGGEGAGRFGWLERGSMRARFQDVAIRRPGRKQ